MIDGERVQFGTSGFLYQSNKLMFDRKTETLWHQPWARWSAPGQSLRSYR